MEINLKANPNANPPIGGAIFTKRNFETFATTWSFDTPWSRKKWTGRGNSGFSFRGTAQILNSYGLDGRWNELGAVQIVASESERCSPTDGMANLRCNLPGPEI